MSLHPKMNNLSSTSGTQVGRKLGDLIASWERSMRAANLSHKTIRSYGGSVELLLAWLRRYELPDTLGGVAREHCEAYLADCLTHCTPGTVFTYHKCLKMYFSWLVNEGELDASPMAKMKAPLVPDSPAPVLTDDQLRALIRVCEATNDFSGRRDLALIRLLIDTGMRRAEISGLVVADVDLDARTALCRATNATNPFGPKLRRSRVVPFGVKAARALDRYVRIREGHRYADDPQLWLGFQGPLRYQGVYSIIQRRAEQAGLARHIWPHLFRHTATHKQLERGDQEGDIMVRMGWSTREMLGRYGASVAAQRARSAYLRQPSPGDLL